MDRNDTSAVRQGSNTAKKEQASTSEQLPKCMTITNCYTNFFLATPEQGSDPVDTLPMWEDRWYGIESLIAVVQ